MIDKQGDIHLSSPSTQLRKRLFSIGKVQTDRKCLSKLSDKGAKSVG